MGKLLQFLILLVTLLVSRGRGGGGGGGCVRLLACTFVICFILLFCLSPFVLICFVLVFDLFVSLVVCLILLNAFLSLFPGRCNAS